MVVVKSAVGGCDRIQSNTLADGAGRNGSDSTFVSKTII
jgi:hypothetical protein